MPSVKAYRQHISASNTFYLTKSHLEITETYTNVAFLLPLGVGIGTFLKFIFVDVYRNGHIR